MKRIVLSIFLLLGYVFCQAQEIKPQQVTADDYIRIFEDMGYKVFSFSEAGGRRREVRRGTPLL